MADEIAQDPMATSLPGVRGIDLDPEDLARQSLPELGETLDRCLEEVDLWRDRQARATEPRSEASATCLAASFWRRRSWLVLDEISRRVPVLVAIDVAALDSEHDGPEAGETFGWKQTYAVRRVKRKIDRALGLPERLRAPPNRTDGPRQGAAGAAHGRVWRVLGSKPDQDPIEEIERMDEEFRKKMGLLPAGMYACGDCGSPVGIDESDPCGLVVACTSCGASRVW